MEIKKITASSREDFRKWLQKNHAKENKVSVVLHKKHTGKPSPTHRELIEEAICFGWIDTIVRRVDENKYTREFSKRNKNSRWSNNTLSYAKKLLEEGRMTSFGIEFYEQGKKKPTHDHGIPKNPKMLSELKVALNKNKEAKSNFEKFAPSRKRVIYRWLLRAKLPETRNKRINDTIKSAKEGKSAI